MRTRDVQGWTPVVLAGTLVAVVAGLGGCAVAGFEGGTRAAGAVVLAAYVAWIVAEGVLATRREVGRPVAGQDRGTLEAYALMRGATVVLTLLFAQPAPAIVMAAGALLLGAGMALRLGAMQALGALYSHRVRVEAGQPVVDRGVYRFLRHPAYTGMLVAHAGLATAFASLPGAAALVVAFLPAVVARILVEERELRRVKGYAEYATGRARLLPGVW